MGLHQVARVLRASHKHDWKFHVDLKHIQGKTDILWAYVSITSQMQTLTQLN